MNLLKTFSVPTLLVGLTFVVVACAEHDSAVGGEAQDLSATHGTCGGTKCGDGLRCCNDKCQPAGLACQAPPPSGGTCGGATCGDGLRCCNDKCQPAGLACQAPPPSGGTCGGATCGDGLRCCNDKCQPAGLACSILSSEGQVCGDDVAIQKKCAAGLTCVFPSSGPVSEHTPGTCQKTLVLDGEWGADDAILTFDAGTGRIEFGCGTASIDSIAQTGPAAFAGTGTQTAGSGVEPPPGLGPKPVDATFTGTVSGTTLTLEITVDADVSKLTFTKDRHVDLIRCL